MAAVVLNDLVQTPQYANQVLLESLRRSVFWNAGVIVPDMELEDKMKANVGKLFEFNFFNDLADNESRISNDTDTLAGVDGIDTGTLKAVGNYRNRSWAAKNITANLSATGDPMMAIAGRVGAYWARQMDYTTGNIITGLVADNVANDAGDMVQDEGTTLVTISMILDALQTSGDVQDIFGTMICHSAVRTALRKAGVTDKVYDDNGKFLYEALGGLRLVINDAVPFAAGSYTSYILAQGFIGYGEGAPKRANETEYTAAIGNGAGMEALWSRKNFCLHPYGFDFIGSPASTSPTNTEFAAAASWNRVWERKRVPLAVLKAGIV